MQLFNKQDFPVFHDILYKFSLPCGKYKELPYLSGYIVDILRPNKKEYENRSNNLLQAVSSNIYKVNQSYVISKKSNNKIDYFITMDVFYLLYCIATDTKFSDKKCSLIKTEAKLNDITFLQFSLKASSEAPIRNRYFLTDLSKSFNIFESGSDISYCKIHIKKNLLKK